MDCLEVIFTGHAFTRMFARGLTPGEVRRVIDEGETIAEYADDKPYPSRLLLGITTHGRVLHVVAAHDEPTGRCYVFTAYEPEPAKWSPDFKRRKR